MADSEEVHINEVQNEGECRRQNSSSQTGAENSTYQSEVEKEFETQNDVVENESKKARKQTSDVWNFFEVVGVIDGKPRAKCKGCKGTFIGGGSKYGTSTLSRHMGKCDGIKKMKDQTIPPIIFYHLGKLRSNKFDPKVFREKLAKAIIRHDLPFKFAEFEGIRELLKYLNPDVRFISRITASCDVWKVYAQHKKNLRDTFTNICGRICLTSDLWTACTNRGYICLTAHYVDLDWKLKSKILAFCDMRPPHSGVELARKVIEIITDWGIDRKIFSLTLDNASANDNMQMNLKTQLSLEGNLLCDGEFFHVRCSAHILNLIVQEGLKVASIACHKIRESIAYVKGSETRMRNFKECARRVLVDISVHLRLDVSTRWNSTYLMLESALKYKRAFISLALSDKNYKHCPSIDEWRRGEIICAFLKPFYDMTTLISGTSYPTSNLYFGQVWKIEKFLLDNVNNEDELVKQMASNMKKKFDKYWSEYSVLLAMVAVFDPRLKLTMLEFSYQSLDPNTYGEKISLVRAKLFQLYDEYAKKSPTSSQVEQQPQSSNSLAFSSTSACSDVIDVRFNIHSK